MAKRIKTGGRKKGTPNRSTMEIRSLLSSILCNEIERIPQYMEEIDPEKKLHLLIKLLPYIIPALPEKPDESTRGSDIDFIQHINDIAKAQKASKVYQV